MKRLTTDQMLKVEGGRVSTGGGGCACGTIGDYSHGGPAGRLLGYIRHLLFH